MLLYDLLLFLHIAAAIIWIGSGFLLHFLAWRAERADDPKALMAALHDMGALGTVLFVPASLATFAFGLGMVFVGGWAFTDLWIILGLAGYLATFAIGFFILKPRGEAIGLSSRARFKGPMEFSLKVDVPRPTADNAGMIGLCLVGRTETGRVILETNAMPVVGGFQATLSPEHAMQVQGPARQSIHLTLRVARTGVTISDGGEFQGIGDDAAARALLDTYVQPMILQRSMIEAPNMRIILREIQVRKLPDNQ